jgi:hypothetical protein
MTSLWNHHPEISSPPKDLIDHFIFKNGEEIFECAIFLLQNDKYLFIRFNSENLLDPNIGVTETEEFDDLNDAAILYKSYTENL